MAFHDEPQWAVVGDTFVVGCQFADSIVYRDTSFRNNPDGTNPRYKYDYYFNLKIIFITINFFIFLFWLIVPN